MNHTTEEAEARPREVRHERLAAAKAEFSSHIQTELLPEKTDFSKVAQDDPPTIRVAAKTSSAWRVIKIPKGQGTIVCSCYGFDGNICSHIDAVLLCGEQHMVHPEDRALLPSAIASARGRISVPVTWRASWKRERAWRGLGPGEGARAAQK
jgi:hypothetical protein